MPESKTPAGYPIRAVARLTGISIDALRAWERRYRAVVPHRTTRGRLYDAAQVKRLMLLRTATMHGHAIGHIAKLSDSEIETLLAAALEAVPKPVAGPAGARAGEFDVLQPVISAIEDYDYTGANHELSILASLFPAGELVTRVVHPLMERIGGSWYRGSLTVAQEHMVSALIRNLLGGLVRLYEPRRSGLRLLFGTPAGEQHEFGILCGAILAVAAGVESVYLGPNLPTPEIVSITNRLKPDALVLGVVAPGYIPDVAGVLGFIGNQIPPETELWVGGRDAESAVAGSELGRTTFLDTFEAMQPHLERLVARPR